MDKEVIAFQRVLWLLICVGGIFGAYIYQGYLQEILSTKRFGPDGQRFQHLPFLSFLQNVVCLVWSYIMTKLWSTRSSGTAPLWEFWSPGLTNTIGPALGLQALKYISYPAQVLAKSSKMIPVMLVGAFYYGIKYTLPEYICTSLVASGVSLFALSKVLHVFRHLCVLLCNSLHCTEIDCTLFGAQLQSSSKTVSKLAHPNAPWGYGLCLGNLLFDGYTNSTQDNIKERFPKTSGWDIMLGMNLWGCVYSLYMFILPGAGGFEAVHFCKQHPEAAWDILWFCVCGAVGQNFIFMTISMFGSLANTTITTVRKFFSILVSSLFSGNPLSDRQWVSVFMVFGGLAYQIYLKWKRTQPSSKAL